MGFMVDVVTAPRGSVAEGVGIADRRTVLGALIFRLLMGAEEWGRAQAMCQEDACQGDEGHRQKERPGIRKVSGGSCYSQRQSQREGCDDGHDNEVPGMRP